MCSPTFKVTHAFSCSIGGLVVACHKKISNEQHYLSQRAFTSAYIRAKPLIHHSRTRSNLDILKGSYKHQDKWGAWWSKVYGIFKLAPSFTSSLVMLTQICTSKSQWNHSWPGGKGSRNTSTVSTVTTNWNFFAVCSFIRHNSREGRPSHALSIESSYGIEKGITPFTNTGGGKQAHQNCRCEVLIINDLQNSAPQSSVGTGARLGLGIENRSGSLNCMSG